MSTTLNCEAKVTSREAGHRGRSRMWVWIGLPAGWLAASAAVADIYTWVDRSGNVTISNLTPPAGVRVTSVTHEPAAAIVRAEALRKYAEESEVRALAERVAQLERALEEARAAPPLAPLPHAYDLPPAP